VSRSSRFFVGAFIFVSSADSGRRPKGAPSPALGRDAVRRIARPGPDRALRWVRSAGIARITRSSPLV